LQAQTNPLSGGLGATTEDLVGQPMTALLPFVSHLDQVREDGDRADFLARVGDREARLPGGWRLFEEADFAANPSLVKGYIGPGGQQVAGIRVVADVGVARPGPWITGANRADHHVSGALLGRDFDECTVDDIHQTDLGFRAVYLTNNQGQLYTLFTNLFVHASFIHVIGNMLFLFLIGNSYEERVGKKKFVATYFIAGLAGTLVESLLMSGSPSGMSTLMIGASGAIAGVMGAMLLLYPHDKVPMFLLIIFLPAVSVWMTKTRCSARRAPRDFEPQKT